MEKRLLGQTGMEVSVLGFGGAEIGFDGASEATVERLLKSALDAGLNVIDTGECYEGSEELIGRTVSGRRSDYYLFTKCGHPRGIGSEDWSYDSLLESIERSLRRLQTEQLDLIQLHSCSESVLRKGEAISALQAAREKGYARYIGYSGDSAAALYAVESGAFNTLQTSINIADQEAVGLTLPLAREKNMGVIAKRPIANAVWRNNHKPVNSYHHVYWDRLNTLRYDFVRHFPVDQSIAHALRFTLSIPGVHTAIVGTSNPDRWVENARLVAAGPLSGADLSAIRERWEEVAPPTWLGQT
ncbi:MAG TPA: aldo/keto reductase [Chthoniobacterales bacterium]|jgi:aryl-alcohol dehydrogenase-like predicted oxidoreductase|nr:aldo/keto reductase [Chthoniobacterales bacterium]